MHERDAEPVGGNGSGRTFSTTPGGASPRPRVADAKSVTIPAISCGSGHARDHPQQMGTVPLAIHGGQVPIAARMKHHHRVLGMLATRSVIACFDRVCIAVAGPRMQEGLGISPRAWGWVTGVFFLAYGPVRDSDGRARRPHRPAPRAHADRPLVVGLHVADRFRLRATGFCCWCGVSALAWVRRAPTRMRPRSSRAGFLRRTERAPGASSG